MRKLFDEFGESIEYWLLDELQKLTEPNADKPDEPPNKVPGETWLRWRSDNLKADAIADESHQQVVFDPENVVINMPDVKFREFLVEKIRGRQQSAQLPDIHESRVLVRTTRNDGPATGDLCDRIDMWQNDAGDEVLEAQLVSDEVPLKALCAEYRKQQLRPGGLFVVHELQAAAGVEETKQWVQQAMKECRRVALDYKPTLPVCLVYTAGTEGDQPSLLSVPGRFRVVEYQTTGEAEVEPLDEDELNQALKKAEEVQQ